MWPFSKPTIQAVTFRLCGWCMLGVFVAGIHTSRTWMPGSFESVHRIDLSLYSHLKEFWGNGVSTHVNSKGKISSTGKILLQGGSKPASPSRTVSPTHYQWAIPAPRSGPSSSASTCWNSAGPMNRWDFSAYHHFLSTFQFLIICVRVII